MDRETLERHLALAEHHVDQGGGHLEKQRMILADLERDGHDPEQGRRLLTALEKTQQLHIADRDRLIRALDELGPRQRRDPS